MKNKVISRANSLKFLEAIDDFCVESLVDKVGFWTQCRKLKNRSRRLPYRRIKSENIIKIVKEHIVNSCDISGALKAFTRLPSVQEFLENKDEKCVSLFRKHAEQYLKIHLPDCPFDIETTERYCKDQAEPEACVISLKSLPAGKNVKYLTGTISLIDTEEALKYAANGQDFSIMSSSRNGRQYILLGPVRFVNHDCNPNAEFKIQNKSISLSTTRSVQKGEEITVFYSVGYFGENNEECLCETCEKIKNGAFSSDKEENQARHSRVIFHELSKSFLCEDQQKYLKTSWKLHCRDCLQVLCQTDSHNYKESDQNCKRCQRNYLLYQCPWPERFIRKDADQLRQD